MITDILLYGGSAFALLAASERFQLVSKAKGLKRLLPSKTLRGSPEDLSPTEVAISVVLPKLLQNYEKCSVTSDRLVYSCPDFSVDFYIRMAFWKDFSDGKIRCELRTKTQNKVTYDIPTKSSLNKEIAKTALSVTSLQRERDRQATLERETAKGLAVLEDLLKIDKDTKADVAERQTPGP